MDLLIDVRVARRDSTTSAETAGSAQDRTVRLRADHTGTVADLIAALLGGLDPADRPQQATWAWNLRTGRRLDPGRPLGTQGLRCGDTIVLGPPEQAPDAPPEFPEHRFELLVVAGPDAGRWLPLPAGEFVIGTDPACDLVLADQTAGRRHLHLGIGSHEVAATDLRSPAGTALDGEPLHGTVTLTAGQLLRLGATLVTVEEVPADLPGPAGPPPAVWLPAVPQPARKRRLAFRRAVVDPVIEFAAAVERAEADAALKHRAVLRTRRSATPSLAHLARAAERYAAVMDGDHHGTRADLHGARTDLHGARAEPYQEAPANPAASDCGPAGPTTGTSSRCDCGPRTCRAGCGSSSRRPDPTPTPRTSNAPTPCANGTPSTGTCPSRPTCGSSAPSGRPGRSRSPTGSCGPG
ncbi:FHA domain-containing protein [Dactylosporangium cerinum]